MPLKIGTSGKSSHDLRWIIKATSWYQKAHHPKENIWTINIRLEIIEWGICNGATACLFTLNRLFKNSFLKACVKACLTYQTNALDRQDPPQKDRLGKGL